MEAWAIFKHAVRMVFGNFGDALRVTGVLYVLSILILLALISNAADFPFSIGLFPNTSGQTALASFPKLPWLALIAAIASYLVSCIWIAIGWHRYVLLGEKVAWLPKFPKSDVGKYFGGLLVVGILGVLLYFICMIPIGYLVSMIMKSFPIGDFFAFQMSPIFVFYLALGFVTTIFSSSLIAFVGFRYAPLFPAIALDRQLKAGEPLELGHALDATEGKNRTLFMLALISGLVFALISIGGQLFGSLGSVAGLVFEFVAGWLQLILGVSLITTIYQRYVSEKVAEEA